MAQRVRSGESPGLLQHPQITPSPPPPLLLSSLPLSSATSPPLLSSTGVSSSQQLIPGSGGCSCRLEMVLRWFSLALIGNLWNRKASRAAAVLVKTPIRRYPYSGTSGVTQVCLSVCVCVCVCVCAHMCVHVCVLIFMHVHVCALYACVCVLT